MQFTIDHAEAVMRSLPQEMATPTRRQIAQAMHRLLTMATFLARIIEANPLPRGFLPSLKARKALQYLYPDEDRTLLCCPDVPLVNRVFYGFLAREGMRAGEAGALTWGDLDLDRGAVTLDENKTDDPRAWALGPGVRDALRAWWALSGKPTSSTLVFLKTDGPPLGGSRLAQKFREHLQAAGVQREALFARTATRQPIRVHDLRATFVTVSLANGKTEAWIGDRTGHRSSTMINRYRRAARSLAELDQGDLAPLSDAIPEIVEAFSNGLTKAFDVTESRLYPRQRVDRRSLSRRFHWVFLAEEEGFEPPVESPLQRISNPPPSTARPLLREWAGLAQHWAWGLSSRGNLCLYSAVPPMIGRGLAR